MRAVALLLFVMATLPMALVRPIIGLLLWMMFSYLNPHRIAWSFAISFPWVMLVAIVTLLGVAIQAGQRRAPPFKLLTVLMTVFLIWLGISTWQAVLPDEALTRFIEFVKMMTMTYVTLMLVTDRQKLDWVIWVIVASFGFWGTKGGAFTLLTGGGYHVMGPEASFFTDNNAFALIMCMTIPLMRYVQLQHAHIRWMNIGMWAVMGLTALAVVGTYSRGGLLALGVTGIMLIWKSRRRGALIALVPVLAVALIAFMPQKYTERISTINDYQQDSSAEGRINSWKFATNKALSSPLFGGGFNVWNSKPQWRIYGPPGAHYRAIHSIFFEVLGEQGFVGLFLFLAMLAAGYFGLARVRKQARAGPGDETLGDLASMLQVSLVSYAAAGTFLPLPYIDLLYQMFAIVVVMQTLAAKIEAKNPSAKSAQPREKQGRPKSSRRRPPRPATGRAKGRPRPAAGVTGVQQLPPW